MTQERWQQIEAVYHAAMEQDPAGRGAYLAQACGSDQDLRREVESLLERDPSSPDNPLNRPAWNGASPAPGARLGPYEILSSVGAGGMGEVWKARDTRLGRIVALKISKAEFIQRFEREARAAAALNHPNICTLHDVGPDYFVMEYVDGRPLKELIGRKGLPLARALSYAVQIADALAAAHAAGVVHRDLKPGNIMVTADDRIKVVDFGLARIALPDAHGPDDATFTLTAAGVIAGTLCYMSPEQAQGRPADARSDIFSFGVVLYEMLTGVRAFPGHTAVSTLADIIHKDPRPAGEITGDLPREMEALLGRCLRKDPARRWQSMADVKVALLEIKEGAESSGAGGTAPKPPKARNRSRTWIAAGVLAALTGLAAFAIWRPAPAAQEVWTGSILGGPIIASHPRISPDGQLLAFRAIVDDQSQVGVMKPDAASWTVLTDDRESGAVEFVSWAHDGSKIYFDREGTASVYSIAPLGGHPRLVLDNASDPEGLPDGSLIVQRPVPSGRRQLWRFWPDSGRLEPLPAQVEATDTRNVAAFRDGKEIAVFGYAGASSQSRHLFTVDLSSGAIRNLAGAEDYRATGMVLVGDGGSRRPHSVAASTDGQSVLNLWNQEDTMLLAAVPRDGSNRPRVLMTFPVGAAPLVFDTAPDGSIYADQSAFDASIVTVEPTGKVLAESRVPKDAYTILPLGSLGYVFTLARGGRSQLMLAPPGSEPHSLLNTNENVRFAGGLLQGGRIVFVIGQGDQSRLAVGSVETGQILQRLSVNAEHITGASPSRDGNITYYAADGVIWAQAISGGAPQKIGEGYDVVADQTGKGLYVMRSGTRDLELWHMPVNGSQAERIAIPAGFRLVPGRISPLSVHSDGRLLLEVNVPGVFFYQVAILDPARHTMNLVPSPPHAVIANASWTPEGNIQMVATHWSSTLWRYRVSPPER